MINQQYTISNNVVEMAGEIVSDFQYTHTVFGERFYKVLLQVERLSNTVDILPLQISERLFDVSGTCIGKKVTVSGQFRSYNKYRNGSSHLILSVFVQNMTVCESLEDPARNRIYLDGYLCKKPAYRKTPLGREITDVLLAVNRSYTKSDYIPCICWGRNARYMSLQPVGSKMQIWGRVQSRNYQKRMDDSELISRTAYEVSVSRYDISRERRPVIRSVADSGQ